MLSLVYGNRKTGKIDAVQEVDDDNFFDENAVYIDKTKTISCNNYYMYYLIKDENENVSLSKKQKINIELSSSSVSVDEIVLIKNLSNLPEVLISINGSNILLKDELKINFQQEGTFYLALAAVEENIIIYMDTLVIEVKNA